MEFGCTGCRFADADSFASCGAMYQQHPSGKYVKFYIATCKGNSELRIIFVSTYEKRINNYPKPDDLRLY